MSVQGIESMVAIVSGGLDSTTMLWHAATQGIRIKEILSFDYGQRHKKELEHVKQVVSQFQDAFYNVAHQIVDVSGINSLIAKGSLTGDENVPKEMYDLQSQRVTVVPNRNMIFIAMAAGRAVTIGAGHVGYAAHASDYEVYPDCRPEFVAALDKALLLGNLWDPVGLYAPFQHMTKSDVVKLGIKYKAPLALTWSCYEGRERPCLECGTCLERTESFLQHNIADPALNMEEWKLAIEYYEIHSNKN